MAEPGQFPLILEAKKEWAWIWQQAQLTNLEEQRFWYCCQNRFIGVCLPGSHRKDALNIQEEVKLKVTVLNVKQ